MYLKKRMVNALALVLTSSVLLSSVGIEAFAAEKILPSAGIDFALADDATSVKDVKDQADASNAKKTVDVATVKESAQASATATAGVSSTASTKVTSLIDGTEVNEVTEEKEKKEVMETAIASSVKTIKETERNIDAKKEEEGFKNLVIADVHDYVNVRKEPSEDSEKVGKLYDNSVGEFLGEENGWYKIESGSCIGYVKAEYCVTGDAAVAMAKEVGTRIATVDTTTLFVRSEPTTESSILGMVPDGEVLTVSEEVDGWAKVNIEEGDGYVCLDFVKLSTEFVRAESKEEEEARLAKEEKERQAALAAANKANKSSSKSSAAKTQTVFATGGGSELGIAVANYALQFNGNPYVYGGTSLTNGADCSGFVLSVYKNFGVSLPHSANADRNQGYAVAGIENAQPGDLICYSGHVGIYIGGGQIIHASTAKTGIKISNVNYRNVLAVRRIF